MKEKVKEWFEVARLDCEAALALLNNEELTPIISFHSHQCIEKCFKAIIEESDKNVPRIHDLVRLYHLIEDQINISLDIEILEDLSKLYIDSRYPGSLGFMPYGKPTKNDALKFYNFANNVYIELLEMFNN